MHNMYWMFSDRGFVHIKWSWRTVLSFFDKVPNVVPEKLIHGFSPPSSYLDPNPRASVVAAALSPIAMRFGSVVMAALKNLADQ